MQRYDAMIIGSGQGGVPLAIELARSGRRVCLFERSRFGGSCVNWGCTPSKAFLGAAHAAGRARQAAGLGIHAEIRVDFGQVMRHVRELRDRKSRGVEDQLKTEHLHVVRAEASFTTEGRLRAEGREFEAPLIVIDTGSRAAVPPIPGLDRVPHVTDREFWEMNTLPKRSLILGGGYVGVELGQGLARLGSQVHIIDRSARVLSNEDAAVSQALETSLGRDGVRFHLGAGLDQVDYQEKTFRAALDSGMRLEGDLLLVAAGRRPNTDALNAPAAGIDLDEKGFVKVNEQFESTRPGVYAIGEAAGQPAFTHVSWEDHRRLLAIFQDKHRTRDDRVLAYAVFTDPQVGRAGLSLGQAREKGLPAIEARMQTDSMARAMEWGHDSGFYQIVIDERERTILGATFVGYEAAELIHILVDLMEAGATVDVLEKAQHIHPTYAENLPSLARMFS